MATYYKVDKKPEIYQETEQGQLRPFIGEKAFLESGGEFGMEQTITPEQFSQYQLGSPIGAEYIKTADSPTVYKTSGSEVRPIKSEEAYKSLTGGTDFSGVATVSQDVLSGYKMGDMIDIPAAQAITSGKQFDELVKSSSTQDVSGVTPTIEEKEEARTNVFQKMISAIKGQPEATIQAREEAEETYGLSEKEAKVSGILESAAKIKTKYEQAIETNRDKPISSNLIRGREGILKRQQSIELQGLAALADIAQGDVESAQTKIDQAVNDAIAIEQASLDALQVELQATEMTDLEKLKLQYQISAREQQLTREQELADQKKQLQLTLLQSGIETSSNETFEQMAQKLTQVYDREKTAEYFAALGMILNPLTGKYEKTAAQKMAEAELASQQQATTEEENPLSNLAWEILSIQSQLNEAKDEDTRDYLTKEINRLYSLVPQADRLALNETTKMLTNQYIEVLDAANKLVNEVGYEQTVQVISEDSDIDPNIKTAVLSSLKENAGNTGIINKIKKFDILGKIFGTNK